MTNDFFDEQSSQSLVKATIVEKYFTVWAKVIIGTQKKSFYKDPKKIAYIDLFAGPGRYKDNSCSTPIKILEKAINDKDIRERLITIFNDKDENNSNSLKKAISEIPEIDKLKYKPQIKNHEIGDKIVKMFEETKLIPTFFFVDPWGYKGLSLRLINSVLKDWGCDCIFFFNYNRINMGLNNPCIRNHMEALFGEEKTEKLSKNLQYLTPIEREMNIIEELCSVIKTYGLEYVLPFTFKKDNNERTSHHLIFVSKHFKGYEIMKDIMAKESSSVEQGVPSFEYNPADFLPKQSLLFQLYRPLDDLKDMLLNDFSNQSIKMKDIYKKHNVDTPYIKKNYKDILKKMLEEKLIKTDIKPRKDTFSDKILVTFPNNTNYREE